MVVTAQDISDFLGDDVRSSVGPLNRTVRMICSASSPRANSLVYLKPAISVDRELSSAASGITIICAENHLPDLGKAEGAVLLCVENPRLAFIRVAQKFFMPPRPAAGVHPSAVIEASAWIDPTASVGAGVYIGPDCSIGARSILHANVTLYAGVTIGDDVIIHAGTVIGADGFGYERNQDGELEKFPHLGGVVIENGVEIGTNSSIDRGTLSPTIIREGAKIDNQVHISHNVVVGRRAAIIAQSMVGGSVRVGDYAWLAPAAIVMNQMQIGERATVGLGAVVVKDVLPGQTVMGAPAVDAGEFRATRAAIRSLLQGR